MFKVINKIEDCDYAVIQVYTIVRIKQKKIIPQKEIYVFLIEKDFTVVWGDGGGWGIGTGVCIGTKEEDNILDVSKINLLKYSKI